MDDELMARSEEEFRNYICDQLRERNGRIQALEVQVTELMTLTNEIRDLMEMGRSLFIVANGTGKIIKWTGSVLVGILFIYHLFMGNLTFKDLFK